MTENSHYWPFWLIFLTSGNWTKTRKNSLFSILVLSLNLLRKTDGDKQNSNETYLFTLWISNSNGNRRSLGKVFSFFFFWKIPTYSKHIIGALIKRNADNEPQSYHQLHENYSALFINGRGRAPVYKILCIRYNLWIT